MNNLNKKKTNEELIEAAKEIFEYYKPVLELGTKYIYLDVRNISEISPLLAELLIGNPEETMEILEAALKEKFALNKILKIRLNNLQKTQQLEINKIRACNLKQIHTIKGIIKRLTKVIPRTTIIKYECPSCGTVLSKIQETRKISNPSRCNCGRKGGFRKLNDEITDIQELILEEIQDDLDGKQPQQIRVLLKEDLTETSFNSRLQPGRRIEVIGIVDRLPIFMNSKDEETNISDFMIHANNIISLDSEDDLTITQEDERRIMEIAANEPLNQLSKSLVPEVYGNDMIKKAIVLQMVKAVPTLRTDGTLTQDDISILLCGDVGLAKSRFLKSTISRTPKSKMVIGTKTSKVGLGAMCVKDELTNTWSLEVGALVLCSGSLLAIDEIDKMYKEHLNELLEPMSLSTVTINRAGISATLPARTSILAAANPIHGNYDLQKPLAGQIDMPTPILNRFDLIFVMKDSPNEEFDSNLVEYIFQSNKKGMESDIPMDIFRKYIIYCKKLRPQLDDILVNYFKDFYINIRKNSYRSDVNSIPVNARSLEALMKLSFAHAKLRLSSTVEVQDLEAAKEIFIFCLNQLGIDEETGVLDWSRMTQKVPASKRGKAETFLNILYEISETNPIFTYAMIWDKLKESGIKSWEVNIFIDELKKEVKICEPEKGKFKLVGG